MIWRIIEQIQTWWNPPPIFSNADGNEETYHSRYLETEQVLGEGEFGIVKVVQPLPAPTTTTTTITLEENEIDNQKKENDTTNSTQENIQYAVKILPKGMTMRDNVLYNPINPTALQTEVKILQKLQGKRHSSPKLYQVYEGVKNIYLITELCGGGNLMDYRSKLVENNGDDVSVEVVARVAYQLLDAVDHCARNGVIHRDIKPANIMFLQTMDCAKKDGGGDVNRTIGGLRLIDYGSGALLSNNNNNNNSNNQEEEERRTTYAGSPFYNSPEMFRKSYNSKTDVWSAGITLYVFAAGFPHDDIMQDTFDLFHLSPKKMKVENKERNLRLLPNVPSDFPGSFYEMLEQLLVYSFKKRASAGDMLDCEFVVQQGVM